ncbi:hypothetical protein JTB14_034764 [Gonioctena quinquepunctata]|nr:hypothetical protein JTB14_034764 [Gonioctena quinquepunctata]
MHQRIKQYDTDVIQELIKERFNLIKDERRVFNKHPNEYTMEEKIFHENFDTMISTPDSNFAELIGEGYESEHYKRLKNLVYSRYLENPENQSDSQNLREGIYIQKKKL